jgi:hypothetical protein
MGEHAVNRLDADQRDVQRRRQRKCAAECGVRVRMAVAMTMMMVVGRVRVIGRHARRSSIDCGDAKAFFAGNGNTAAAPQHAPLENAKRHFLRYGR